MTTLAISHRKMNSHKLLFLFLFISTFHSSIAQIDSLSIENLQNTLQVNELFQKKGPIYGSHCGFIGEDPNARKSIEHYIESKQVDFIHEWLASEKLVEQVYAAEALLRLEKEKGYTLNYYEREKIRKLSTDSSEILTCSGCSFSHRRVDEIIHDLLQVQ